MTLDLTTLQKIRAEVDGKMHSHENPTQIDMAQDTAWNAALTDLLNYLDTEIAKAKNHD